MTKLKKTLKFAAPSEIRQPPHVAPPGLDAAEPATERVERRQHEQPRGVDRRQTEPEAVQRLGPQVGVGDVAEQRRDVAPRRRVGDDVETVNQIEMRQVEE